MGATPRVACELRRDHNYGTEDSIVVLKARSEVHHVRIPSDGWQERGIGNEIITALVNWVEGHAPDKSFLGLLAPEETIPFYERFGFAAYAHDVGMYRVIRLDRADRSDEAVT